MMRYELSPDAKNDIVEIRDYLQGQSLLVLWVNCVAHSYGLPNRLASVIGEPTLL